MAIVWPCPLSVEAYVAAGRDVEVPRPACPSCGERMSLWGSYTRDLRVGGVVRLYVRRARCPRCRSTHGLLPDFVVVGRLDTVEVIGPAIEAWATGTGARTSAERAGVPHTTVRGWCRRTRDRGAQLVAGLLAVTAALGDLVPRQLASGPTGLVVAVEAVVRAARRRLGSGGAPWRVVNRIVGGALLAPNTDSPFLCG